MSSNARWSSRASFVKVIKTENSLYLLNEDICFCDFFSLFLGVQSAPEAGPTSYETPCIHRVYSCGLYACTCAAKMFPLSAVSRDRIVFPGLEVQPVGTNVARPLLRLDLPAGTFPSPLLRASKFSCSPWHDFCGHFLLPHPPPCITSPVTECVRVRFSFLLTKARFGTVAIRSVNFRGVCCQLQFQPLPDFRIDVNSSRGTLGRDIIGKIDDTSANVGFAVSILDDRSELGNL